MMSVRAVAGPHGLPGPAALLPQRGPRLTLGEVPMPNRILREGIISSPRINALSPGAELLYRRLMSVVDDFGRFHGSPVTIRGACWPTCPEKINHSEVAAWLEECCAGPKPLISRYKVDGATYLQVSDFRQQTRTKSKFPEPDSGSPTDCEQNDINDTSLDVGVVRSRMRIRDSGTDDAFHSDRDQGYVWFKETYPNAVNDFVCATLFISVIESWEDLASLKKNLPLQIEAPKWSEGFWPSAENYLSKREFRVTPKPAKPAKVDNTPTWDEMKARLDAQRGHS